MIDTKGCGRIDVHDGHPWRRPLVLRNFRLLAPRWYDCPGTPVIEGGARPSRTSSPAVVAS